MTFAARFPYYLTRETAARLLRASRARRCEVLIERRRVELLTHLRQR